MIKIAVSASRNYNVIMKEGSLANAGQLFAASGITAGAPKSGAPEPDVSAAGTSISGASASVASASGVSAAGTLSTDMRTAVGSSPKGRKLCIITDKNVDALYGGKNHPLWLSLESAGYDVYKYVFPGGEEAKSMDTISNILNYLADNRFSRSDILVALGGGITGDVTGFAAASYLRGIEYVQLPTTLLATVDSSVGGKTGVNLNAGKNLAGAFWQPSLVLFDPNVLDTLTYDIILDGIAESVKAGFIGNANIIREMEQKSDASIVDSSFLTNIAAMAVEVKRKVVQEDERETGSRQLLNFGHTPAHAIEKCSGYSISHGHAVAIGMAMISAASDKLGWSREKSADRLLSILKGFKFPLDCPYSPQELTAAALQDKKIRGSNITIVYPYTAGECRLKTIPTSELLELFSLGLSELKQKLA